VLWGNKARDMVDDISTSSGIKIKHSLTSVHPSGLSANRGFFGNNHFKEINKILGSDEIIW
jgi:uracil-DNA glycosylase